MNHMQEDLRLLPNYFKNAAWVIILLNLSFLFLYYLEVLALEATTARTIFESILLIGLLLLAISKNKTEDEMTIRIRLRAFTAAFIYGVGIVILRPLLDLIIGEDSFPGMEAIELLLSMFFFYFITSFIMRKFS